MTSEVTQVGGTHYKAEYQHWDWVEETGMGYLESCASKYLVRWREKGGVQDLEKSLSYVKKLQDLQQFHGRTNRTKPEVPLFVCFEKFKEANNLPPEETACCVLLMVWSTADALRSVVAIIESMIRQEQNKQEF